MADAPATLKPRRRWKRWAALGLVLTSQDKTMHRRECMRVGISIVICVSLLSCDRPNRVEEVHIGYDISKLDQDKFPPATKRLFDSVVARTLPGAAAKDHQADLDTAQEIRPQGENLVYMFQLDEFHLPFEKRIAEGVPYLFVIVEKKYGLIFKCGIGTPEH
jgi:hypothetical protein